MTREQIANYLKSINGDKRALISAWLTDKVTADEKTKILSDLESYPEYATSYPV